MAFQQGSHAAQLHLSQQAAVNTVRPVHVGACVCRIVSATDLHKYDDPPGLQDNWEIVFNFLAGVLIKEHSCRACCGQHPPANTNELGSASSSDLSLL